MVTSSLLSKSIDFDRRKFDDRGEYEKDPDDAALLAKFLEHHLHQLRRWQPDAVETRQIAELTELRRKLVEERKRIVLRLNSSLKGYFPLALKLSKRDLFAPATTLIYSSQSHAARQKRSCLPSRKLAT